MNVLKITGKDNEKIKFLRKLRQKKYRDKFSKFFVENAVIIRDAVSAGVRFDSIFVTGNFLEKNKEKFDFIHDRVKAGEYYVIDEKINRSFSQLETPSGICAVYSKPERKIDFSGPIIYLNSINDPGNLGTILRSALAFSIRNIIVDEKCADIYNSKTVNAAKDSIFKLNIGFDKDLKILSEIKSKMKIFTTVVEKGESINILGKEKLFCLVLGSEARGADKKIRKMSDGFVEIKMSGEVESLNVASAAAIIFYEIYKNRK